MIDWIWEKAFAPFDSQATLKNLLIKSIARLIAFFLTAVVTVAFIAVLMLIMDLIAIWLVSLAN